MISMSDVFAACVGTFTGGFIGGWAFRGLLALERGEKRPPHRPRSAFRLWCALTDHDYSDPPGSPEPFCRRCGYSGYWPVRRTIVGVLERLRYSRRKPPEDIPF